MLPLDGSQRTGAPHAAHLGVHGHLLRGGGLFGNDDGVVADADDDVLQRIPVVPGVNNLSHCSPSFLRPKPHDR